VTAQNHTFLTPDLMRWDNALQKEHL